MNMMKAILTIALTLAITIAIAVTTNTTTTTNPEQIPEPEETHHENEKPLVGPTAPKKRVSRFLAEDKVKNPRAADHCKKDGDLCAAANTSCCNNKCVDIGYDSHNCGACNHKCKYTEVCCGRKCVNLSFDKRHCGSCKNKCLNGKYCIYGLCDYA